MSRRPLLPVSVRAVALVVGLAVGVAVGVTGCGGDPHRTAVVAGRNQRQVALESIAALTAARLSAASPAHDVRLVYPPALSAGMTSSVFLVARHGDEVCVGAYDRGASRSYDARRAFVVAAARGRLTRHPRVDVRTTICGQPSAPAAGVGNDAQSRDLADQLATNATLSADTTTNGRRAYPDHLGDPLAALGYPPSRTRRSFHAAYAGHRSYFCLRVWNTGGLVASDRADAYVYDSRWGLTTTSPVRPRRIESGRAVSGSCRS